MSVQDVTSLVLAIGSVLGLVVKILGDAKGWFPNKATSVKPGPGPDHPASQ